MRNPADRIGPYALLAFFCLTSLFLRPLIPADETRYLTVAWEMLVRGDVFVPSLNFQPYHHKPPLLFWLIDASWSVFGVGRWSAMLVVFAISALVLHLTRRLASTLFPDNPAIAERVPWLMVGGIAFVIYSSLVLFDMLLTACVLSAVLALHSFARTGQWRSAALAGIFVGLGILAKGPVMLIHVAWPVILYPWWRDRTSGIGTARFLRGAGLALLFALLPVAFWLVPALLKTDGAFAYALLWEQSAGRISGAMEASHPRPFYFYLLLAPVLLLPWLLSPRFWQAHPAHTFRRMAAASPGAFRSAKLLAGWTIGIVGTFSLISGKQPHYVAPVIPLVTILVAVVMEKVSRAAIRNGAGIVILLFTLFQVGASRFFYPRYDLSEIAAFIERKPERDVGFVGFYQGEFNFLARRTTPIDIVDETGVAAWFSAHPGGYLVHFHSDRDDGLGQAVLTTIYRDNFASVVREAGTHGASTEIDR